MTSREPHAVAVERDGFDHGIGLHAGFELKLIQRAPRYARQQSCLADLDTHVGNRSLVRTDFWKIERGDDGKSVILTFATPDHLDMSFAVPEKDLNSMAESVIDYEVAAYPGGLRFH